MAVVIPIRLKLYHLLALNRWICERCNDGFHYDRCLQLKCECPCRGVPPPKRARRSGESESTLTVEERERQMDFRFDGEEK
jgi:hypothetical protein